MKQLILDDTSIASALYPFTATRHTSDIRVGILTIREKWELLTGLKPVLARKSGKDPGNGIVVPANIIPTKEFAQKVLAEEGVPTSLTGELMQLEYPWHIFQFNDRALREDFELLKANRHTQPIPETVQIANAASIFVEPGARLSHCMLNALTGPIYIGKDAEIMEGSFIRGPFALGEGSTLKMGSRVYGATSIGPSCVIGGEIKNSVIFGYSNKAHDGYLGDSVIGEWCNLGAGTSNSNIKNTAGDVKVWNKTTKDFTTAGQKCGLLMGDYSRSAINSSFNTGTIVGVCCNVFGEGLTEKYIPDFTWGNQSLSKYEFEKALKDIAAWKKLKNQSLSDNDIQQLKTIFEEL